MLPASDQIGLGKYRVLVCLERLVWVVTSLRHVLVRDHVVARRDRPAARRPVVLRRLRHALVLIEGTLHRESGGTSKAHGSASESQA